MPRELLVAGILLASALAGCAVPQDAAPAAPVEMASGTPAPLPYLVSLFTLRGSRPVDLPAPPYEPGRVPLPLNATDNVTLRTFVNCALPWDEVLTLNASGNVSVHPQEVLWRGPLSNASWPLEVRGLGVGDGTITVGVRQQDLPDTIHSTVHYAVYDPQLYAPARRDER